jgi:hypothetical protein
MIILISIMVALTRPVNGGQIRMPLPELVGSYELSDFTEPWPDVSLPRGRTVQIETHLFKDQVWRLSLELSGEIEFGSAVGDGIFRETLSVPLTGLFASSYRLGNWRAKQFAPPPDPEGEFEKLVKLPGTAPYGPPYSASVPFEPEITVELSPWTFGFINVPYVTVPNSSITLPDTDGILVTTPMRGEITSAILILDWHLIPEPSGIVLLGLGLLSVLSIRRNVS